MKVELKPTIARKSLKNLRKMKAKSVANLKQAAKDTFNKTSAEQSEKKILVSRKYPNWCDGEDTQYVNHTIATRTCFYPEDERRMEKMTDEQKSLYRYNLIKTGRYYRVESSGSLKELEEFLHSCGKELKDVLMQDNCMKVELTPTIARKSLKNLRKIKTKSAAKLKQTTCLLSTH